MVGVGGSSPLAPTKSIESTRMRVLVLFYCRNHLFVQVLDSDCLLTNIQISDLTGNLSFAISVITEI